MVTNKNVAMVATILRGETWDVATTENGVLTGVRSFKVMSHVIRYREDEFNRLIAEGFEGSGLDGLMGTAIPKISWKRD
jgi:hypothetical protein